jgi:single-stranded-DNA-specific exonuclease
MSRPSSLRRYRWNVAKVVPYDLTQELAHLHPVLLQVLHNRKLDKPAQIESFLAGRYLGSSDPFLLSDMDRAVARVQQAIEDDEIIVVYGDFDADGVTSTVLLVEALRGLGLDRRQVRPYIPDRVDEGYGLNSEALKTLRQAGAGLVISVDCGIRSVHEIVQANEIGLDMIITDHHTIGRRLPPAFAVVNPKRPDSEYPEEMLAGVGIAFKVAQALRTAIPERAEFDEEDLLDLVALGTVADLAPLLGENRKLVRDGLEVLNSYRRPGVQALADISGLKKGNVTAESIAFGLGPRINAAGRLSHAYDAARLLASNNMRMATDYARELNGLNRERQRLTASLTEMAKETIDPQAALLFSANPNFKSGVVGLVASRLAEKYYRPAIVVEQGEEESRGSCRSIPEFHITEALDEVEELLERHGGHAMAAGFTVKNENLDEFRERIIEVAAAKLAPLELAPVLSIDAEINVGDIDWALQGVLEQLEPTGTDNLAPIFMSRNVHVYNHRPVGQDDSHLQLSVGDGRVKLQCIAFRQGDWAGRLPDEVDLAYTIGVNEWNGRRSLQLVVQDIREVETTITQED